MDTSWENVADWYGSIVSGRGMYFHEKVIVPHLLKLLDLKNNATIVDLGCGNGFFASFVRDRVKYYLGIDASPTLIKIAKNGHKKHGNINFVIDDLTKKLTVDKKFTHAVSILVFQNIEDIDALLMNASNLLLNKGILVIVLNHPCFRIPRVTSWGIDYEKKIQYRRVDRYMSEMRIPINVHPSQKRITRRNIAWTFHRPISFYFSKLRNHGFYVELLQELVSDKVSVGKYKKMEDRARTEIPLFMVIKATKF